MEAGAEHGDATACALRFFYIKVLKRGWSPAETPHPKKVLHLPHVLSQKRSHV
jgi:hypothetical protein